MAARPAASSAALPLFPDFVPHTKPVGGVEGIVQQVLHVSLDSGFTVALVKDADGREFPIKGKSDPLTVGDQVEAEGQWVVDAKWGEQFQAKFIKTGIVDTVEGVRRFVLARHVPGLGAKSAERLVDMFGDKLPQVMDKPTTLMAAGLSEDKARELSRLWILRTRHGRLMSTLQALKIGPTTSTRILEQYGDSTLRVVTTDPYRLAKDIRGIGFKIADRIAVSQGWETHAPDRIAAGLRHQMETFSRDGDCAAARTRLVSEAAKLLLVAEGLIEKQVEALLLQGDLVEEQIAGRTVVYDRAMRACEIEVAEMLVARLASNPLPTDVEDRIVAARGRLKLPPLHENQADAVRLALRESLCVVTGSPGTGKTSTVSTVLACLEDMWPGLRIGLAAPTGRAAQRLSESTGFPAVTLHRLLEWSPEVRGFTRNKDNKLQLDVLVVDESSMPDIWIVRDLLRALPLETRLIFVGDVDQLASVGAGNVLGDMIESGAVPTARLTFIFRQGAGSAIATAAQKINAGVMPPTSAPTRSSDMWGVFVETPQEVHEKLRRLVTDVLPKIGFDARQDLQILAPGHNGDAGTVQINLLLQEILNPAGPDSAEVKQKDRVLRVGDRVIQTTNNYDLEVFNGDIGYISAISTDDRPVVEVNFDGRAVVYRGREVDELDLAYCISIHKSQGSEFAVVVVVLTKQHYVMLKRNLAYTGVSRARKLCCILGVKAALSIAVRSGGATRLTGLAQRLAGMTAARDVFAGLGQEGGAV